MQSTSGQERLRNKKTNCEFDEFDHDDDGAHRRLHFTHVVCCLLKKREREREEKVSLMSVDHGIVSL